MQHLVWRSVEINLDDDLDESVKKSVFFDREDDKDNTNNSVDKSDVDFIRVNDSKAENDSCFDSDLNSEDDEINNKNKRNLNKKSSTETEMTI